MDEYPKCFVHMTLVVFMDKNEGKPKVENDSHNKNGNGIRNIMDDTFMRN